MKKFIYKVLLISLFIIIISSIKSFGASDFSYTIDANGDATITAYNGTESNLTIPSIIDGYNVTTIGAHAFDESGKSTNGHTIKNLVISEGIKKIELLAFAKCTNLETVKLPESLTVLDMQAFIQCSKLKSINIPSKITSIGNSTFQETGFTEIDLPENVKYIDSRALGICSNLKKVRVYSKDISYASGVFEYGSADLVLYGYEGSTTQIYAQQNEIKFEVLSSSEQEPGIKGAINLNKNKLELKENESEILTISFIEISPDIKVIWSCSDESIASVENGKVIAKNIGNAIITVSTVDGKYKDTCAVSVLKGEPSIEYGKTINDRNWTDTIILSELKENEIYRYTANNITQFPEIKNDTKNNCFIYIKGKLDNDYKKEIKMNKEISSLAISFSSNEYEAGESFCITYETVGNEELLKAIQKDEIIYLSNYNNGDKLKYQFEKYIYNDTEKDIIINIKNTSFGAENSESITIPKGEIYGFDYMIDSASISYSENNIENNNKKQNEKENKNQQNEDNTKATGNLPKAGTSIIIKFIILFIIVIVSVSYKKHGKFKDIK